jgi:glycosyltransferase involved in cell wall biosynthesis
MARWKSMAWSRYHQIFTLLAESGHNVHVIQSPPFKSGETNFQEINVEIPDKLHIHDVNINPFIWGHTFPLEKLFKKGYYSVKSLKKAKELLGDFKIDVLFLYNIPQYPLMEIGSCMKIFDIADDYMAMLRKELGGFSNPLLLKIGRFILERMIKKSDITLSVSRVLADSMSPDFKSKVYVLPNGVDLDSSCRVVKLSLRQEYKRPVIGFIGSFEYFIDFDIILGAAKKLQDYTFLLVGTGREFNKVKSKVEELMLKNVILIGGVPHSEISGYIDLMDICLNIFKKIPISHGACPIKVFEYLAMKKPVISTRLEEIKNIDRGFIFYADNVNELVNSIKKILFNKIKVVEYVERGYNIVKENYLWSDIVKRLLNIITQRIRSDDKNVTRIKDSQKNGSHQT